MSIRIERAKEILESITNAKVAVYGDFCLDVYWMLDPHGSEISVETGLQAQAVKSHYYSLGGAGNIVANLAALKPAHIQVTGVIGNDIFGRELCLQLEALNVDTTSLIIQREKFDTFTYCKRYLKGEEKTRIDFGFLNQHSLDTDKRLIQCLRHAFETADVVLFNQQFPGSITNKWFFDSANKLFSEFSNKPILLDSRHYGEKFHNVYHKTNAIEAAKLNGQKMASSDIVQFSDLKRFAAALYKQSEKPVFITRGQRGILVCDNEGTHEIPGIQILKKTDPVGAGDTIVSTLACCLAVGTNPVEAAECANFAAAVTVQKLFQTGTASYEEILEIAKDPDYIYQPELAEDTRQAKYFKSSEIETCCDISRVFSDRITHAIFDNDGTISTIRQGWERVMEPVMIKAILGNSYECADETLYCKVRDRVRSYINQSTGIQTILQMAGLVEMVREFGIVPPDKILDSLAYKAIYNRALMDMVGRRIEKLKQRELDVTDYTIKGVISFLQTLREKGVELYLASGTDRKDAVKEANALSYANLFNGGIYGALDDINKFSKKKVIEKILHEHHLHGSALACFGDGPVEMRECRKHDGVAIGIASDEIRRHGLNMGKRSRLIKAGAHIVVPDFSQPDKLLSILFEG